MKTIRLLLIPFLAAGLTSSRAQDTWTQKADFGGVARRGTVGFSIGSKGYIGTGCNSGSKYYKDFWEYDPATDSWTQKVDFAGTSRWLAIGFSIANKGYIGTGYDGAYRKDFWQYDPVSNSWEQKSDFGGSARSGAVEFSIGNKGYVGTGYDDLDNIGTKDFWEYDPSIDTWTQKADFGGTKRRSAVGFSTDEKGYIGTGYDGGAKNDFWEYDPNSNSWTQKANFGGSARWDAVGLSVGNKGYIGTGCCKFQDFWEYDPSSNTWTQKANFGGAARNFSIGFSIGSKGYIGTGETYIIVNDFWEYTPQCSGGLTVYADADGDGYGDAVNSLFVADCVAPTGYAYNNTDCNDGNANVHPSACDASNGNGIDENCDGIIDNGFGTTIYYADVDGDGYGAGSGTSLCIDPGPGYSTNNTDCDDNNTTINPIAYEIIGDGVDNNCNGIIDEDVNNALNFDGLNDYVEKNITSLPLGNAPRTLESWIKTTLSGSQVFFNWGNITNNQRCGIMLSGNKLYFVGENNDAAGTIPINDGQWHHVAITFDGVHLKGYVDGVLDINTTKTLNTVGTVLRIGRRAVPENGEYLNGSIDEISIWSVARTQAEIQADMNLSICGNTSGLVTYYPLNQGIAEGNNTSIVTTDDIATNNNDGALNNFSLIGSNSNWVAGAPNVISVINATYYQDADGDGYGNPLISQESDCTAPSGYVLDKTDCNDGIASVHPGACDASNGNGIDENCDGVVDNGFGATIYYIDADGDGYGAGSGTSLCSNPGTGYSVNNTDCNPTNPAIHPGAIEIMNGIDDDCNGIIDDIAQNIWTKKADFGGVAREAAVGFSIGGKGYIGTGYHNGAIYKDFWEYDAATDVWTQKADYAGNITYSGAAFAIGNKGYVGTGSKGGTVFNKDFWEYDPASNTWTQKADFAGSARYACISFSIGNKGYVGTGFNWGANGNIATNLKDFWEYDPATDTWTQKADYAGGICDWARGFSIGTKGYVGTGIIGNPFGGIYTNQFWEYDPDNNTWTQKSNFGGTARAGVAGFSIGGKGYIGAGNNGNIFKDFWEYDPIADSWSKKADYGGGAVNNPVGFSINGKGYLGTGENGANYKGFWEYTPVTNTALCEVPSGEATINITGTTADLVWNDATTALGYVIKYNTEGGTGKAKVTYSKSNSKPISGLTPNTAYFWRVKSVCSEDPKVISDWSEKYFFTTAPFKIGDEHSNSLTLFPNPVLQQFTLNIESCSTTNQAASIYLLNVLGQTVYSSQEIVNGELTKVITMPSSATSGWYVVRVVMSDQVKERMLMYQK